MSKWMGLLIRRERLRRSFSQEGLCRGICAVSYLSKIEQGKAEAGEDILLPLLERLGIRYEAEPDFLHEAEALVEALYGEFLSGRTISPPFPRCTSACLPRRTVCSHPPLCWTPCCCWL